MARRGTNTFMRPNSIIERAGLQVTSSLAALSLRVNDDMPEAGLGTGTQSFVSWGPAVYTVTLHVYQGRSVTGRNKMLALYYMQSRVTLHSKRSVAEVLTGMMINSGTADIMQFRSWLQHTVYNLVVHHVSDVDIMTFINRIKLARSASAPPDDEDGDEEDGEVDREDEYMKNIVENDEEDDFDEEAPEEEEDAGPVHPADYDVDPRLRRPQGFRATDFAAFIQPTDDLWPPVRVRDVERLTVCGETEVAVMLHLVIMSDSKASNSADNYNRHMFKRLISVIGVIQGVDVGALSKLYQFPSFEFCRFTSFVEVENACLWRKSFLGLMTSARTSAQLTSTRVVCQHCLDMLKYSEMGASATVLETIVAVDPNMMMHAVLRAPASRFLRGMQAIGAPTGTGTPSPTWQYSAYLRTPGIELLSWRSLDVLAEVALRARVVYEATWLNVLERAFPLTRPDGTPVRSQRMRDFINATVGHLLRVLPMSESSLVRNEETAAGEEAMEGLAHEVTQEVTNTVTAAQGGASSA